MIQKGTLALFLAIHLVSACIQTQRNSDVNYHSEIQNQTTDTLYGHPLEELSEDFHFLIIEEIEFGRNGLESIRLEKIVDQDVPGDIHKISFRFSNNRVDSYFNKYGWVKIDTDFVSTNNPVLDENSFLKNYILLLNTEYTYYFNLIGYTYANDPPLLSIFRLDKSTKISLVLNQERNLVQIKDVDSVGGLELVLTEYDADVMQYIKKHRYDIYSIEDKLIYLDKLSSSYERER